MIFRCFDCDKDFEAEPTVGFVLTRCPECSKTKMTPAEAREIVWKDHCPMCGTQRCTGSEEYMEGCGHYMKLMGIEDPMEKIFDYMKSITKKEEVITEDEIYKICVKAGIPAVMWRRKVAKNIYELLKERL